MENDRLDTLFRKYLDHTATPVEEAELFTLLSTAEGKSRVESLVEYAYDNAPAGAGLDREEAQRIFRRITRGHRRKRKILVRVASAAVVAAVALTATFYIADRRGSDGITDLPPGTSKAILTLANGTAVALDAENTGEMLQEYGVSATNNGETLVYTAPESPQPGAIYTLSTQRGGQYRLVLPDGSRAWLNADSGIEFPENFATDERHISVRGEVYLEVEPITGSGGHRVPFVVDLPGGGRIEVLGTGFNINAYEDEDGITTTLVEGAVHLFAPDGAASVELTPGTKGVIDRAGGVTTAQADIGETTGWKEGKFSFTRSDIRAIMRQLARWYDIDVSYPEEFTHWFGGTISRDVPLSQALETLELTGGVRFKVTGRTVTVLPGKSR